MAMFSHKGWSSDFRMDNFTSDQLERYMDGLRDDMAGRHDTTAAPRRIHKTAAYVKGYSGMGNAGVDVMPPNEQEREETKKIEILHKWAKKTNRLNKARYYEDMLHKYSDNRK